MLSINNLFLLSKTYKLFNGATQADKKHVIMTATIKINSMRLTHQWISDL
jgi:hypothetical protein